MSDYIERERAMDIFGDVPGWRGYYEPFTFNIHQAVTGIVKVVREEMSKIPTADVAPVAHGHFVHDGPRVAGGVDWWHCSNCGKLVSGVETHFDYCPWCGAKMDGGDRDE